MQEGLARAETLGSGKEPSEPEAALIETDIPARLERLPWGRFHALIGIALGVTWILDGLEVTLAGAVAGAGSHVSVAAGYALGAALMSAAGIIAARFCIPAERKPLEVVAPPLWQSDDL